MLNQFEREQLKDAARSHDKHDLDRTIERLKQMVPHKFHSVETLRNRIFFDEPKRAIPHALSIRKIPPHLEISNE